MQILLKFFASLGGVTALRVTNVIGNAATGVVLAHQLSLSDRGNVATITSVIGIAVIFIASPKGEYILKNRNGVDQDETLKKASFDFSHYIIVVLVSLSYLILIIEFHLTVIICAFISALILFASINSLRQAFMFHKFDIFGHQLGLASYSIFFAFVMSLAFSFFDSSLNVWLSVYFCTELIFFFTLRKINRGVSIEYKWFRNWRRNSKIDPKIGFVERISVYLSAFYMQLIIIIASILYSSSILAYFAIGISLCTVITLPLSPYLPKLLSKSKEFALEMQNLKNRKSILLLIGIVVYLFCAFRIFPVAVPILYGAKYKSLIEATSVIIICGVLTGIFSVITTLLRGLERHHLSILVSGLGLCTFTIVVAIWNTLDRGINGLFFSLMFSNSVSVMIGIIALRSRKKMMS